MWSADGKRLTVLFDPGRVKRDVAAAGATAAPLQPGAGYRIAVGDYRRSFRAGPALRTALNPNAWRVDAPTLKDGALTVHFDRVMDAALTADQLVVAAMNGRIVSGRSRLDAEGTVWRFMPQSAWSAGEYRVLSGPMLEDVSGNRIGEALDHELVLGEQAPATTSLVFTVTPSARSSMIAPRRSP